MAKQNTSQANPSKLQFPFERMNYILLLIGLAIITVGFLLMQGGGSEDPAVFNEDIFSFRRITLSPIIILLGYVFVGYAIMYRPKKS